MLCWVSAANINGFNFLLMKDPRQVDAEHRPLEEVLDDLAANGRVLAVVDETKLSDVTDKFLLSRWSNQALIALFTVLPCVMLSKAPAYASAFFCRATLDDPERKLLERDDIDLFDSEGALAMARQMGADKEKLAAFYAVEYAYACNRAVEEIVLSLSHAVRDVYPRRWVTISPGGRARPRKTRQLVSVSLTGNLLDLLLGIPDLPDEKTFADKDLMRDVARISHTVIGEYGDFNGEAKKVIWDLEEAWEDAVPMFAELYLANHPDASDEIVISTEEIIQTMFLDYAGEAFAAGVPIEDILC